MSEIFKINDVDYECEFTLKNPDGQETKFTKSAIRGMTIVDNIFEPFLSASISIANPFDFIERDIFLRGDGRDELSIKFKPVTSNFKDEFFEHEFVIVDDGDMVNVTTTAENIKIFNLISKDGIKFIDTIPYGKKYKGFVGDILQEIFIELLGEDKVDKENWERGDFEINEYCPPSTFRYMDVLRYFLRIYYAKDGDLFVNGFVTYDDVNKKFRLDLLSKIFEDNNKYAIEAMGYGDSASNIEDSNPNNPQSGPPVGKYIGGIKSLGYSTPPYSWTTDYFLNSLVIGYDPILGEMKMAKLDFKELKKKWQSKFVDTFKAVQGKPKPFAIENKTTEKRFKRYQYAYPLENCVKMVEAEIYSNLTFSNLQISFLNTGLTSRRSGKFIDIFSTRGKEDGKKSNEKVLGRWLMTEVRHIFFADLYTNQIYGTKTYVGPTANFSETVE